MNWKDYLFFQKRDRNAIIVLLTLIVVCGGLLIFINDSETIYADKFISKETEEKFKQFQIQLEEREEKKNSTKRDKKAPASKYDSHTPKLTKGKTIELNSADTTALKTIPGIGSVYSNRIVKYRNILGGYTQIEQLKEVWGIDEELFDKIAPFFTVIINPRKIKINEVSFYELRKHPYISYQQAKAIQKLKDQQNRIEAAEELNLLKEFSEKELRRLKPYLSFD